ncbi:MAG: hypothetical protein KDG54_07215 [Geminicoccaceae bacterium]|nr:hypothetical protein [Geminicoccaceae bacterium]
MSISPAPADFATHPFGPAQRMLRWSHRRLLRFAWLRAMGRSPEPGTPDCRDIRRMDSTAPLPASVRSLIAAFESMAVDGRDGLRSLIVAQVRPWFNELCQRLFHQPEGESRDQVEWMRWATQRRGRRPLEALVASVLRQLDQSPRPRRSRTGYMRPPSPETIAERTRELRQDPVHQQALQRSRGRRSLVRVLTRIVHSRLMAVGAALLQAKDTFERAATTTADASPAPPDDIAAEEVSCGQEALT